MDPTRLVSRLANGRNTAVDAAAQAEFSEKRRVWIPEPKLGFVAGWVKAVHGDEHKANCMADVVVASTGEVQSMAMVHLTPMNPPQFDKVADIADLTHLNEASVVHNLRQRYSDGGIYTYSGLFLISLNPYTRLPIYTPAIIASYRTKRREENAPHIYAIAERAWQQMGEQRESQSVLITGESGAGKTENTKKVIQYLAAIASSSGSLPSSSSSSSLSRSKSLSKVPATGLPRSSSFKGRDALEIDVQRVEAELGLLEQQILQANPVLEAFGNAQTARNNNSSRFGKFIRIFFSPNGSIAGATIDWYLLEKSRVTARAEGERAFHVFYQLLKGAKLEGLDRDLLLEGGPENYEFLRKTRKEIDGVDDLEEWRELKNALAVVGLSRQEQFELFRIPAVILHIGNLLFTADRSEQAQPASGCQSVAERVCHLLGISPSEFLRSVLRPKVKAGREWVTQARTKRQADDELAALCKFMYEKTFGQLVARINKALDRPSAKSHSIGVLDIAGFEIFLENGYEQLLINFTNEKLQQFFNHHMFVLEQEEYSREGISWNFVNFGLDLQPTIELIESSTQPIGILAVLDEECIMPKASDLTFTEKVRNAWETPKGATPTHAGSNKFKPVRFGQGFIVKHYAGEVEYRTEGWLEKNKDPINDAVARLLAESTVPSIAALFTEYAEDPSGVPAKRGKRGAFRTVGQRHKEQLNALMDQLRSTQPHFVRCIVPNSDKQPLQVDANLVLDQLRCNGVLEGIRIARLGYPNRHTFSEFRQRYEVLTPGVLPPGYMDGRKASQRIAEALELSPERFKVGATKIFFKAGVLAELEERRDHLLTDIFRRFQSAARMYITRRKTNKTLNRTQAIRTIQRNARVYIALRDWPWWSLYVKVRPLLAATRTDDELVKKQAELAMAQERAERDAAEKEKIEALRVQLEADKARVESELASERQLGVDKDHILERSKAREAELLETISGLEADLEGLDEEREAAELAAAEAREKETQLRQQYELLVQQAGLLEKEGTEWRQREALLLSQSSDRAADVSRLDDERLKMTRQLDDLKRELTQKEDLLKRQKERMDATIADLEKRINAEKSKHESNSLQMSTLQTDFKGAQAAKVELSAQVGTLQDSIKSLQADIARAQLERDQAQQGQVTRDRKVEELSGTIDALRREITSRDAERHAANAEKQQLVTAVDDLRKVMAAKSSEDTKRSEAEKSRAAELDQLRQKLTAASTELERHQTDSAAAVRNLQAQLAEVKRQQSAGEETVDGLRREIKGTEETIRNLESASLSAKKAQQAAVASLVEVQGELEASRTALAEADEAVEELELALQDSHGKYNELEDALLPIQEINEDLKRRLQEAEQQLASETERRQKLERQIRSSAQEAADLRNTASELQRQLLQMTSDLKKRDADVALLKSRENKTIVEHVHVLEAAKKVTDRQLAEKIRENDSLVLQMRSLEAHRTRLISDVEDVSRQMEMLRAEGSKAARDNSGASGGELDAERRARQRAEARAAALEKDLQDSKRQLSTMASPARSGAEGRAIALQNELTRSEQALEAATDRCDELAGQVAELQRVIGRASPRDSSQRTELLRGLQQSNALLGRDMSTQLRKLSEDPGSSYPRANGSGQVRDIASLQQQLSDEREEKEFLKNRLRQFEDVDGGGAQPFLYEGAMFSHFRAKAKSLRSQLDHWLAMEDMQAVNGTSNTSRVSPHEMNDTAQQLKHLLAQLDPEVGPIQ